MANKPNYLANSINSLNYITNTPKNNINKYNNLIGSMYNSRLDDMIFKSASDVSRDYFNLYKNIDTPLIDINNAKNILNSLITEIEAFKAKHDKLTVFNQTHYDALHDIINKIQTDYTQEQQKEKELTDVDTKSNDWVNMMRGYSKKIPQIINLMNELLKELQSYDTQKIDFIDFKYENIENYIKYNTKLDKDTSIFERAYGKIFKNREKELDSDTIEYQKYKKIRAEEETKKDLDKALTQKLELIEIKSLKLRSELMELLVKYEQLKKFLPDKGFIERRKILASNNFDVLGYTELTKIICYNWDEIEEVKKRLESNKKEAFGEMQKEYRNIFAGLQVFNDLIISQINRKDLAPKEYRSEAIKQTLKGALYIIANLRSNSETSNIFLDLTKSDIDKIISKFNDISLRKIFATISTFTNKDLGNIQKELYINLIKENNSEEFAAKTVSTMTRYSTSVARELYKFIKEPGNLSINEIIEIFNECELKKIPIFEGIHSQIKSLFSNIRQPYGFISIQQDKVSPQNIVKIIKIIGKSTDTDTIESLISFLKEYNISINIFHDMAIKLKDPNRMKKIYILAKLLPLNLSDKSYDALIKKYESFSKLKNINEGYLTPKYIEIISSPFVKGLPIESALNLLDSIYDILANETDPPEIYTYQLNEAIRYTVTAYVIINKEYNIPTDKLRELLRQINYVGLKIKQDDYSSVTKTYYNIMTNIITPKIIFQEELLSMDYTEIIKQIGKHFKNYKISRHHEIYELLSILPILQTSYKTALKNIIASYLAFEGKDVSIEDHKRTREVIELISNIEGIDGETRYLLKELISIIPTGSSTLIYDIRNRAIHIQDLSNNILAAYRDKIHNYPSNEDVILSEALLEYWEKGDLEKFSFIWREINKIRTGNRFGREDINFNELKKYRNSLLVKNLSIKKSSIYIETETIISQLKELWSTNKSNLELEYMEKELELSKAELREFIDNNAEFIKIYNSFLEDLKNEKAANAAKIIGNIRLKINQSKSIDPKIKIYIDNTLKNIEQLIYSQASKQYELIEKDKKQTLTYNGLVNENTLKQYLQYIEQLLKSVIASGLGNINEPNDNLKENTSQTLENSGPTKTYFYRAIITIMKYQKAENTSNDADINNIKEAMHQINAGIEVFTRAVLLDIREILEDRLRTERKEYDENEIQHRIERIMSRFYKVGAIYNLGEAAGFVLKFLTGGKGIVIYEGEAWGKLEY